MRQLLVVFSLLVLVLGGTIHAAEPQPELRLQLHRGSVDARAPIAAGRSVESTLAGGTLSIIQFDGPITLERRDALADTGVTILEYLPDFAYLVRGEAGQLAAAEQLPNVYARTSLTLADKLAPSILRALRNNNKPNADYRVLRWSVAPAQQNTRSAQAFIAPQLDHTGLLQLAADPSVRWIEPASQPRLLNDVAATIMHVPAAREQHDLYGAGQIVGVADSGLDTGNPGTLSPDFAGRIAAMHVLAPDGDIADTNGHGTHVAGSIAGSGVQSGADPANRMFDGSFAGVAPEAKLVVQAFEVDGGGRIIGLDDDYYALFQQAYDSGARLHSDSWGDVTGPNSDSEAEFGGYPAGSQLADEFVWEHPDMAIFFAAGNSGTDGTPSSLFCSGSDGIVDSDSLLMPGTAKNVITVGASENVRASGGLSNLPWFGLNLCFLSSPIITDTISNNARGMAAFSSRGPTDDERIKPDIVAPGTNILSNRSHAPNAGTLWGVHETNKDYVYSGGSSMATPLAAGAGALVREWLSRQGMPSPSAAALKAVLLNTAADMAPGQYGTGPRQEIPNARPNSVAGWGRTDLGFLSMPAPYQLWVDDHTQGLATNQSVRYTHDAARPLVVTDSSQPLKVMLTWTDPPASLSASRQLVNDLDLVITAPDGTTFRGNGAASADRTNNVEGVIIANPQLGSYTVEVQAYNVPIEEQPYALVVGGPLGSLPASLPTLTLATTSAVSTVAPGGLITYTLALSADHAISQPMLISNTLPLSTTFESASSDGVLVENRLVRWHVASLPAGATATRTLVVRLAGDVPDGTVIRSEAHVATSPGTISSSGPPVIIVVQRDAAAPNTARRTWLPITAQ